MKSSSSETTTGSSSGDDDESLNDILNQVESLLTDSSPYKAASTTSARNGWRNIDWIALLASSCSSPDEEAITTMDNNDHLLELTASSSKRPSPVETILVKNRIVYLKRDDLLRLPECGVSGNKARKLYALHQLNVKQPSSATTENEETSKQLQQQHGEYFPRCVVSHGGPQSNAMVALAAIVHSKNVIAELAAASPNTTTTTSNNSTATAAAAATLQPRIRFVYYTKKLPHFLRNQPSGNLFRAQSLGMELVELSHDEYRRLFGSSDSGGRVEPPASLDPPVPGDSLWVPQGGACGVAWQGGRMLAQEIASFWSQEGNGRPLTVCVPGGTCTTALFLHREVRNLLSQRKDMLLHDLDIRVVIIPCVGDDAYARRQMMALNLATGGTGDAREIPTVLPPAPDTAYFGQRTAAGVATDQNENSYFRFGEPDAAILKTCRAMEEECGVNLDLLYGAPSWTIMIRHWRMTRRRTDATGDATFDETNPLAGREIMYVHSGGLEGITSQLTRYRYKGLVGLEDVQYPTR